MMTFQVTVRLGTLSVRLIFKIKNIGNFFLYEMTFYDPDKPSKQKIRKLATFWRRFKVGICQLISTDLEAIFWREREGI